jgi:hypothetical protein
LNITITSHIVAKAISDIYLLFGRILVEIFITVQELKWDFSNSLEGESLEKFGTITFSKLSLIYLVSIGLTLSILPSSLSN